MRWNGDNSRLEQSIESDYIVVCPENSVKVNKRIDPTINISLRKMFGRRHRKPIPNGIERVVLALDHRCDGICQPIGIDIESRFRPIDVRVRFLYCGSSGRDSLQRAILLVSGHSLDAFHQL